VRFPNWGCTATDAPHPLALLALAASSLSLGPQLLSPRACELDENLYICVSVCEREGRREERLSLFETQAKGWTLSALRSDTSGRTLHARLEICPG
jgi:hypothetical protein